LRKRILLLTGNPGVGKTTVVMKVVDSLRAKRYKVGGMVSREVRSNNARIGFEITDLTSGKRGWLAHTDAGIGPRVGKYHVEMDDLESVGMRAIVSAVENSDVVIIDEIGPMELFSRSFRETVERAAGYAKLVVGVVHRRFMNDLVESVKSREDALLFEVTVENRNRLPDVIVERAIIGLSSRSKG